MASIVQAGFEPQPMFERRSLPVYVIIFALLLAALPLMRLTGLHVSDPLIFMPPLWAFPLLLGAFLARRIGYPKVGGACETITLAYFAGMASLPLFLPLVVLSGPYADTWLSAADRSLGFNWVGLVMVFKDRPLELNILAQFYHSFLWQPALLLVVMWSCNQGDRAWRFVIASLAALLICIAIFPFTPAVGPYVHYGIRPEDFTAFPGRVPWRFHVIMDAIRHGEKNIDRTMLTGFVCFPSYHTAMGILIAWAAWPLKGWRWVFLIVNAGLIFAAVVVGGHYFIDIIAGAIVALIASKLAPSRQYKSRWAFRYPWSIRSLECG